MSRKGISATVHRRSTSHGLTAIELLVAMALSTILMVVILGLMSTLRAETRELVRKTFSEPWKHRLNQQLRRDLANARQMTARSGRLEFRGFLGTDAVSDCSTLQAAQVTYQAIDINNIPCLVRDEVLLATNASSGVRRQLAGMNLASIRFDTANMSPDDDNYMGPVPNACRITVFDSVSLEPLLVLHWSGVHR
jgi:hypothetical protein